MYVNNPIFEAAKRESSLHVSNKPELNQQHRNLPQYALSQGLRTAAILTPGWCVAAHLLGPSTTRLGRFLRVDRSTPLPCRVLTAAPKTAVTTAVR